LEKKRKEYYNILEKTQKGNLDITEWLMWFLESLNDAIKDSLSLVEKVRKKSVFWENNRHIAMNERQTKMINMLWDHFEGNLTSSKWAKITKCSSDTALRDIQDLIHKGILIKNDSNGRSTSYRLAIEE
jgi:Fic family protein